MFDEIGKPSDEAASRKYALAVYGLYCVVGFAAGALIVWKRGISRPVQLAAYAVVFLLSLFWMGSTLRTGPPVKRKVGFHGFILNVLCLLPIVAAAFHL